MQNLTHNKFLQCFVISFVLHFLVLFIAFYQGKEKKMFIQVPIDVSFYSPFDNIKEIPKPEEPQKKEPVKTEVAEKPKIEERKIEKDDIVVNKKEKEKPVKKEEPKKETPKEPAKEVAEKPAENYSAQTSQTSMGSKGIMLENADFKYSYYTTTIVKKISRNWQWSAVSSTKNRAVVYFRISKNGDISSVELKESSGDAAFDQNAIRAVKVSSPFAPLPSGYNQDYLGVYFEFKLR